MAAVIVVGTNSYVTVAEADAYFADQFGYESWEGETNKEGALISACNQQLDPYCEWYGYPTDENQALAFPRSGDTEVPESVKIAQMEIAYQMHSQITTNPDGGDPLTKLKAGSVELGFEASQQGNILITDYVTRILGEYGLCSGSGSTRIIPMERA